MTQETEAPDNEGFARRWSRRKRLAAAEQLPVVPAEPEPPSPVAPPVELPPPAETIPIADIAGWMQKRLPDGWREVALRRLWSADIGIRDFIGPADYAWDWNVPGGAPGGGPMRAADDMVRLLARAMGEPEPVKEAPEEEAPLHIATAEPTDAPLVEAEECPVPPPEVCDPAAAPAAAAEPPAPVSRRGGRATPV